MSGYDLQATLVTPPGAGTSATAPSAAAIATAIDLSAFVGKWVAIIADGKTRYRFGAAGVTSTAGDVWMPADVVHHYYVPSATPHLSVYGDGAAREVVYAGVSDAGT